jgi:uncharacterized protein (TIRG00374 family)
VNKKIVLSWIVSIVLLVIVASKIDFSSAIIELKKISLSFLVVSVLVYSFSFLLRALRWKYLIKPLAEISFVDSFSIVCVSFLANNVLPARLGEFLRAFLLSKKKGIGKIKSFSTVVVDRVIDGITLIFVFFAIMVFSSSVPESLQKIMVLPVIVFAFGMGFFVQPSFFRKALSPLFKKIPFVYNKVHSRLDDIVIGGKAFSQGFGLMAKIWASSFLIWGIEATNFFVISTGLGIHLSFAQIVLLLVIVAVGSMIPSAPAYIGTFEALFVFSFLAFGLSAESGIAMAITIHAIEFFCILILGLMSLNVLGMSFKELTSAKTK